MVVLEIVDKCIANATKKNIYPNPTVSEKKHNYVPGGFF